MTGVTNQIEYIFSPSVKSIIANDAAGAGGVGLIPVNPNVAVTGTVYGSMFTVWDGASTAQGLYTPMVLATYNNVINTGTGNALPSITTINLGSIQNIINPFTGTIVTLTSISAPSLIQISNDFSITAAALTSLSIPALKYVGGNFSGTYASLTTLSAPALIAVNGLLNVSASGLTTYSMPNLVYAGNGFTASYNSLTSLNISNLSFVGATFTLSSSSLTSISLTSLANVNVGQATGTAITLTLGAITSLSLPALVNAYGSVTVTAANLTTFSVNSGLLNVQGNWTMTNMKLNQASVDGILVRLAALDGTAGTTSYNNRTVNLSGGTSSAPSATGLAAKTTLQARGCTVTTN